jgi:N-acyl-D-aspartate/D-glutamate deacylase
VTSLPATRYGITDRGVIAEGKYADIMIFDPLTVKDRATFEKPKQYPQGIPFVIVNGEIVVDNGEHTGAIPGKVLKKEQTE